MCIVFIDANIFMPLPSTPSEGLLAGKKKHHMEPSYFPLPIAELRLYFNQIAKSVIFGKRKINSFGEFYFVYILSECSVFYNKAITVSLS